MYCKGKQSVHQRNCVERTQIEVLLQPTSSLYIANMLHVVKDVEAV